VTPGAHLRDTLTLTLAKSLSHLAKINPIWQTTAELQGKKALLSKIDFIKKKKKKLSASALDSLV
jgi:hypothetical protein